MAKKNGLGLLLLLGLGGAGYFFLSKKKQKINNQVSATFGLKSVQFKGTNILAKVSAINPTNFDTKLTSFTGNILSGKTAIATVKNFTPVAVPANSEVEIPVTLVPKAAGLFTGLKKLLKKGSKKKANLSLVGVAKLGANNVNVNFKF